MSEVSCQVVTASTLFGAATVVAAWDAGVLPRRERTVLVVQHNVTVPEASDDLTQGPAFAAIADRFDAVVSWNDVVEPYHPKSWKPRGEDAPLWERQLRSWWRLGDGPVELVGESVATSPTRALVTVFESAAVTVYADGLMVYGPTRFDLPHDVGGRIERVLHLDLLPGVSPTLLAEWDVPGVVVPSESFRKVVGALTEHALVDTAASPAVRERGVRLADQLPAAGTYALLLGQYMAAINLLTVPEEAELHRRMVDLAAERGFRTLLLKPHPSAPRQGTEELAAHARSVGVDLQVAPSAVLAESLYAESAPGLVVSCFSTALATARSLYDVEVVSVGTDLLLERLEPYANSNRVPAVVVDALWTPAGPWGTGPEDLQRLVRAVSYCQQPRRLERFRDEVAGLLTDLDAADEDLRLRRWFRRKRLTALGLPGGLPVPRTGRLIRGADVLDRRLLGGRLRRLARRRFASGGDDLRAALGAARSQVAGGD